MSIFEKFFAKLTSLGETSPDSQGESASTEEKFKQEQERESELSKERLEQQTETAKREREAEEVKKAEEEIGPIEVEENKE